MKQLNKITLNDIFNPCGFNAIYRNCNVFYCNGYITIKLNNKLVTSFVLCSYSVNQIKNRIKTEIIEKAV